MRKCRIFGAMISVGVVAMLLSACGGATESGEAVEYPILSVSTSNETLDKSYSATIRGRQDIDIYPQISGKITSVRVKEGEVVRKGQTLFVIDRVPYEAALRVAEANLAAAKVGVESAELEYNSTKELFENDVVSSYELQQSLNSLHSAQATLAQMEAQQIDAANNLSYTEVTSPSNGVVGTIPYREGALVSASMATPLTTVSDNSEMYVYFSMDENSLLDMLQQYGSVEKALAQMPDVQLQLSNGSIYNHTGRVESISGVISQTTGTVSLRAIFANPDRLLHSGANGSILFPEHYDNVITIPQESTFELQDKVLVYKVVDGVTRSTQITVSPINDGRKYIVTGGLEVGDQIIAAGAGLLKEGMPVKAAAATTAPEQSVASAAGVTEKSNENVKSEE